MTDRLRPPLADRQEELPVCFCGRCMGEVYSGEAVFGWEKQRICADCFNNVVVAWLEDAPLEVAGELGVEIQTV